MRKFKRSAGVVIESPHQARVLDVGELDGVQDCFYFVMVGKVFMMGWSSGTLQSKTLRGLVTARRRQSTHILSTTGASALRRASLNFARSAGQPTEFSSSVQLVIPTRSSSVVRSSRISASLAGDWLPAVAGPMTSAPI